MLVQRPTRRHRARARVCAVRTRFDAAEVENIVDYIEKLSAAVVNNGRKVRLPWVLGTSTKAQGTKQRAQQQQRRLTPRHTRALRTSASWVSMRLTPIIPLRGVRISWLISARYWRLAVVLCSASFVLRLLSCSCVLWPPTRQQSARQCTHGEQCGFLDIVEIKGMWIEVCRVNGKIDR